MEQGLSFFAQLLTFQITVCDVMCIVKCESYIYILKIDLNIVHSVYALLFVLHE